jgi:hypothetical protein
MYQDSKFGEKMYLKHSALWAALTLILALALPTMPARAQLSGSNTKGDMGLMSGSQPGPGWYVAPLYYNYSADTFRDQNGDSFPGVEGGGTLNVSAAVLGVMWVSDFKLLGGTYGFSVWPGVTNNALEYPPDGTDTKVSTGLADLYIQPISLGWHKDRADYMIGLGVYIPTGEYESDGDSNRGLGMWSYEIYGGATVYIDQARSWHVAMLASYETHGKKDGSDVIVGNLLTVEGGLGKSFGQGLYNAGIAYYAQWKLSDDDFGVPVNLPAGPVLGKHRVYGIGPEVSIPLKSSNALYGFLGLRYLFETGAKTALEGNTLVVALTVPIPSISLQ